MHHPLPSPTALSPVRAVLGFVCVAFATAGLRSTATDWLFFGLAAGCAAALLVVAWYVPWQRLPIDALLAPAVGCDLLVALLRQAQGGYQSGYSPLLVLPAVWAAFVIGRRGSLVASAAAAATLVVPIYAIGAPLYPSTGLRGVLLLSLVTTIVGLVTAYGVAQTQVHASESARRAEALDRVVQTHTAIALSDFGLEDILRTVAAESLALTGADAAVVELPEEGDMVYRAAAGTAAELLGFRVPAAGSASGRCLATMRPLVVPDTEHDDRVDREACRRVGARSLVVVPLIHGGRAAGVLKVYSGRAGAVGEEEARVLGLLGNVIGAGLARAEVLATISEHAQTDALTGLANRRSWDDQLGRAIAHAERTHETLSVAICDVDGLKWVNDHHGHAAGDALLRDIAARWRAEARAADLIARIGGDEFALLLPGADEHAAAEVVERLANALPPERSVSVGVAEWDLRESAEDLMARADLRMYDRKRRTRAAQTTTG